LAAVVAVQVALYKVHLTLIDMVGAAEEAEV
jgi:hypothetical protein